MNNDQQNPENTNQETLLPHSEVLQPPKTKKEFPKKLVALGIALLATLVVAGLAATRAASDNNQSAGTQHPSTNNPSPVELKAAEQVFVNPIDNKKIDIKKAAYYTVVVGNTEYYGQVSKINNDYIRMTPTAYKKEGVLTIQGKELHGPELATYFRIEKVTKFQELTDTAIIEAMKNADTHVSDAFPSNNINEYIKSGQFQAYFFTDGMVLFAKTTSLDGAFLASSSHVYVLRANNSSNGRTEASLVLAKPEQYNTRTSTDLAYWQNMNPDSQIAKAATDFEKQNP